MATGIAPRSVGNEPDRPGAGTGATTEPGEVVDLDVLHGRTPLPENHPEQPVDDAVASGTFVEVELPRSVATERISTRMVASGIAAMLAVVLAPLLVLLAAVATPSTEQVQGAVLVVGWIGLATVARWIERRRTRHRRGHRP